MKLSSSDTEVCVNCSATARSVANSIFRTWLSVKRYHDGLSCGRNAVPKNCARPRLAVFRRDTPWNDISSWAELDQKEAPWWLQNWKNGLLHSLPRRQPSSRKEGKDVKDVNWWQPPLNQVAGTIGSHVEAVARSVRGCFVTTSDTEP